MDDLTNEKNGDSATALRTHHILFKRHITLLVVLSLFILFLVFGAFKTLAQPPAQFPQRTPIKIEEGSSLSVVAETLKMEGVIRSPFVFMYTIQTHFGDQHVQAGTYYFEEVYGVRDVAEALVNGTSMLPPLALVIPEGLRVDQIDEIVSNQHPQIEPGEFLAAAGTEEGYLFPDTYYVPENFTAEELVALMQQTFTDRIESIEDELAASSHSLNDIIIMASILEREANSEESKRLVSGILWKRIEIDMPLQVDAVFEYIYKRSATELTSEDLLIDSPYNTYKNLGLPPTPIVSPGLESILATLYPTESDYLYYITAPDGTFYYAETFDEHKQNIARYLR